MRVLLVEDEQELRQLAMAGLRARGFIVDGAASLAAARDSLAAGDYDLAVVDRRLEDGEGLGLLAALRQRQVATVIASAMGETGDRIDGLDAGADDYVVKPYDLDELAARLRALLRRPGARRAPVIEVGPLRFDPAAQDAELAGQPLGLGRREAALLHMLMIESPRTLVRDRVEDRLYGFGEEVTPNAVEALVSRLRRRLAGSGVTIEARRGIGWRLCLEART